MMKKYIKDGQILSANRIVLKVDGYQIINPTEEILLENGWSEYIAPESSQEEAAMQDRLNEIENLKQELVDSDYKVIKCMEANFCGEELPYDIIALHEERNELRRRINELESL